MTSALAAANYTPTDADPRSGAVTEALVASVLEQRVTTFEARRAQGQLVARWGEPAPGPTDLMLPPHPEVLAGVARDHQGLLTELRQSETNGLEQLFFSLTAAKAASPQEAAA